MTYLSVGAVGMVTLVDMAVAEETINVGAVYTPFEVSLIESVMPLDRLVPLSCKVCCTLDCTIPTGVMPVMVAVEPPPPVLLVLEALPPEHEISPSVRAVMPARTLK